MAVTTGAKLDAHALREDFPIFAQEFHGKPLAYLDSAATPQKPRQMLDAMRASTRRRTQMSTAASTRSPSARRRRSRRAREKIARLLNAPAAREMIFVRNATEGINLVAYAWGLPNLGPGDVVLVTELEHHSNFVPWQYIAKRTGAEFRMIPLTDEGELVLDALDGLVGRGAALKVVAPNLVSNALGTVNAVERLTAWAHEQGAIVVVDAAQAAPHRPIDVQAIGCDFLAISAHKMCGAERYRRACGAGRELLERMEPFLARRPHDPEGAVRRDDLGRPPAQVRGRHGADGGGGRASAPRRLPHRGRARGDRAARARPHRVRAREAADVPASGSSGRHRSGAPASSRFTFDGVHPHDVAQVLDWEGVAIRAGHHCCQPLMARLGVAATNRASFYLYTIPEEIDRLVEGLHRVRKVFG